MTARPLLYYFSVAGLISIRVNVRGKVQGVFYRATVADWANELKVMGWIRNEADGSVTAIIQHSRQGILDELLARMWRGSARSIVTELHSEVLNDQLRFADFSIKR